MEEKVEANCWWLRSVTLTFQRVKGVVVTGEGGAQFQLPALRRVETHAIVHGGGFGKNLEGNLGKDVRMRV